MNDTVDIDAFLNLNEYDDGTSFASPELSPPSAKTPTFLKHEHVSTPPSISPSQPMCGPSHDYGLYKQQTPFAPGAIQMTFATMEPIVGYNSGIDLFAGPSADFDFNATPSQGSSSGMDLEFGSPSVGNDLSFEPALHSAVSDSQPSPIMPATTSTTSNVGRMWPGMHQQAALAKAQAQERQQQQMMAQQRRIQAKQPQPQQHQRAKSGQPTDPIVEQKITQLLNSMRAKPASPEDTHTQTVSPLTRIRKDEEDMDEDERLLASEEGKKLTSKERRQLRNKVSARAFRSRRKEYITQLEAEITSRVTENGDLRSQNRALLDENRRLTDLTKMLLSSPSFSNFLDQLSTNPSLLPQAPQAEPQQQAPPQPEPTPAPRQMPKDVNPNSFRLANGGQHQQQIGLTLVPEQPLDLTSLGLGPDSLLPAGFEFAPQVFTAVIETPDLPEVLAAKPAQRFDDETLDSEDDGKVEFSASSASYPVEEEKSVEVPAPSAVASPTIVDEDDGSDLFDDIDEDEAAMAAAASMPQPAAAVSEKPSADRIEITVAEPPAAPVAEEEDPETVALKAMKRVERMVKRLESLTKRFEDLAGL